MKTYSLKKVEVNRDWFVLDVTDMVLGRVATKIADRIRGSEPAHLSGASGAINRVSVKCSESGSASPRRSAPLAPYP